MQDLCCRLTVRHHSGADFHERVSRNMGEEVAERIMTAFPPVEHPLVRTHPVTGRRALFVSGRFMDQIVGHAPRRERRPPRVPQPPRRGPELLVRWHWTEGDVAVWDEASTNHRALSDHYPAHRVMRRCTVDGTRPYFTS